MTVDKVERARELLPLLEVNWIKWSREEFRRVALLIKDIAALEPLAERGREALEREERAHLETIDQREQAESAADMLARDIARITGAQIGEHSNLNDPWAKAHEVAEEYIAALREPSNV